MRTSLLLLILALTSARAGEITLPESWVKKDQIHPDILTLATTKDGRKGVMLTSTEVPADAIASAENPLDAFGDSTATALEEKGWEIRNRRTRETPGGTILAIRAFHPEEGLTIQLYISHSKQRFETLRMLYLEDKPPEDKELESILVSWKI